MEQDNFDIEMARLQSQWKYGYGPERMRIIWNAFKDVPNFDFRDAVTECLSTCRSAPLVPELSKAVDAARQRAYTHSSIRQLTPLGFLKDAARANKTADREFVDACIKLLSDYHGGKLSRVQFLQGCDFLDATAATIKNKAAS